MQTNLRNARATWGTNSAQYMSLRAMVEEAVEKLQRDVAQDKDMSDAELEDIMRGIAGLRLMQHQTAT